MGHHSSVWRPSTSLRKAEVVLVDSVLEVWEVFCLRFVCFFRSPLRVLSASAWSICSTLSAHPEDHLTWICEGTLVTCYVDHCSSTHFEKERELGKTSLIWTKRRTAGAETRFGDRGCFVQGRCGGQSKREVRWFEISSIELSVFLPCVTLTNNLNLCQHRCPVSGPDYQVFTRQLPADDANTGLGSCVDRD